MSCNRATISPSYILYWKQAVVMDIIDPLSQRIHLNSSSLMIHGLLPIRELCAWLSAVMLRLQRLEQCRHGGWKLTVSVKYNFLTQQFLFYIESATVCAFSKQEQTLQHSDSVTIRTAVPNSSCVQYRGCLPLLHAWYSL